MSLFDELIIYFFMFIAIALCIATVYFQNPINAVLSFIGVFIITACFLLYIGVEFLAIVYLLVYIGAVAVLFLFIVMLLNAYTRYTPFQLNAFVVTLCVPFLYLLISTYRHLKVDLVSNFFNKPVTVVDVQLDLLLTKDTSLDLVKKYFSDKPCNVDPLLNCNEEAVNSDMSFHIWQTTNDIHMFGQYLYTQYSVLFIVVTLILFVALIGVIVLTIHKNVDK